MFLLSPTRQFILFFVSAVMMGIVGVAKADEYADVTKLLKSKQYTEALTKIDQALAAKPRDPQMRFLKGVIQSETGKTSDATVTFVRLTEDYPELPEPYNNLAVIYASTAQYDKARNALEMAIRTNPSYATAHENLGDIYAKLASQSYAKALQLDTTNTAVPSKLSLIRELFPVAINTKPSASSVAPNPPATVPAATTVNPVVAPVQPKMPTAVLAAPTGQPNVAPPAVSNALASRDVEAAVTAWAQAWSNRDMKNYLASYTKDYAPSNKLSHDEWQTERKLRIMGKARIIVKLSNLTVSMSPNAAVATVKFKQDYRADTLATSSRKTLELVKAGDRWVISKEIAG